MLPKTPRATGQIRSTNGYSPRRDGATVRRGASLRALAGCGRTSHGALTSWKLALHPELYFGELYMDGALILERGTLWDLLELLGRNLAEKGLTGQLRHFADCSAAVAAKQFPPRGSAACRTPLRPLPSALSAVSRHRSAVFLRLFRRPELFSRTGARRQEAPHRSQAAARTRPPGPRCRLWVGRSCTFIGRVGAGRGCGRDALA
jgi:hypothetical protein